MAAQRDADRGDRAADVPDERERPRREELEMLRRVGDRVAGDRRVDRYGDRDADREPA